MYPVDEYQTTKNGKKFKISIGKMKYTDKKGKYDWHYNVKCQQKIGRSWEELKQDYWFDDLKDANDKVYELMICKDINDILGTEILKRFKLKIG